MIISASEKVPLEKCPALVLNADFRPLSYYPLSLWCWQDAVKSVFLQRVSIVSNYKRKISNDELKAIQFYNSYDIKLFNRFKD